MLGSEMEGRLSVESGRCDPVARSVHNCSAPVDVSLSVDTAKPHQLHVFNADCHLFLNSKERSLPAEYRAMSAPTSMSQVVERVRRWR